MDRYYPSAFRNYMAWFLHHGDRHFHYFPQHSAVTLMAGFHPTPSISNFWSVAMAALMEGTGSNTCHHKPGTSQQPHCGQERPAIYCLKIYCPALLGDGNVRDGAWSLTCTWPRTLPLCLEFFENMVRASSRSPAQHLVRVPHAHDRGLADLPKRPWPFGVEGGDGSLSALSIIFLFVPAACLLNLSEQQCRGAFKH